MTSRTGSAGVVAGPDSTGRSVAEVVAGVVAREVVAGLVACDVAGESPDPEPDAQPARAISRANPSNGLWRVFIPSAPSFVRTGSATKLLRPWPVPHGRCESGRSPASSPRMELDGVHVGRRHHQRA